MSFFSFDLDLDARTLILKLDPDIVKMHLYAENEILSCSGSKVIACIDRNTDRNTDRLD